MHVELYERNIAEAFEAVHLTGFDDEDVTRASLELDAVDIPVASALADELNLIVRVAVWSRSLSGKAVKEKHGDADIAVIGADEVVRAAAMREIFLSCTMHQSIDIRVFSGITVHAQPRAARVASPSDTEYSP